MKKLVTIVGARPQIIKAFALSRAISRCPGELAEVLVHTGQHYDDQLSGAFFREMGIPAPALNLEAGSGSHARQTANMLPGLEDVLRRETPDAVVLYGDTNSTLAGALAAAKLNLPIIHIEAGLRSGDMDMPEEVNRVCTDRVSTLLFAPTPSALCNLEKEGTPLEQDPPLNPDKPLAIHSGDVMLDIQRHFLPQIHGRALPTELNGLGGPFILSTFHREKNTHDPERLSGIVRALLRIAGRDMKVVIPMHPGTERAFADNDLEQILAELKNNPYVFLTRPLGYLDTLKLLKDCVLLATDSGGLQKEAYFMDKATVVFRDETEWTELVEAGAVIPAGTQKEKILYAYDQLLSKKLSVDSRIFGNGQAAQKICHSILEYL